MTATTNQNTETQYINFHAEGICYVNRFRTNEAQNGDTWCSVTLGFLHGAVGGPKNKKPRVTYIDCNVRNTEICEILQKYEADILGNSKVTAIARVSDIYDSEPFEATIKNKDGSTKKKMVSAIKARLIGMKQLKINGEVVFSKLENSDSEGQFSEDQNDAPVNQDEVAESAEAPVEQSALAPEVQLDPNAPDFGAQRDHWKELGYVWDRELKLWVLRQAA